MNRNQNKYLFLFENCVYNLETHEFISSNPTDYINFSCGYKYNVDIDKTKLKNAKTTIKIFVDSILLESDREYVWTFL